MKFIKVEVEQNRHLIPVKGWASVKSALEAFAEGRSASSRATTNEMTDRLGEGPGGGMAVGMFLLATSTVSSESRIVKELLSQAESALKQRDEYSRSYDYDAMGTPFFKGNVGIETIDREQDMYGISLYAAYVGEEIEIGLANYLGITRGLRGVDVMVEVEPSKGDRFTFDFETIVRKLDGVLGTGALTGTQVLKAIRSDTGDGELPALLARIDGFDVAIAPDRVGRRFSFSSVEKRDTWSFRGSILSGDLRRAYGSRDENEKAIPRFIVSVTTKEHYRPSGTPSLKRKKGVLAGLFGSGSGGETTKPLCMWHPEQQDKAIALAERIAAALR